MTYSQHMALQAATRKTGQNCEQVVLQAIDHLALQEELGLDEYAKIMAGLADAEAGSFASDQEAADMFAKYGVSSARKLPCSYALCVPLLPVQALKFAGLRPHFSTWINRFPTLPMNKAVQNWLKM